MHYSIIIPVHNEEKSIPDLLKQLEVYANGNEILFINDGSNDNSKTLLNKNKHINVHNLDKNFGKGFAIKRGLKISSNNKIVIYDGDLELKSDDIKKLMILDKSKDIHFVIGSRTNRFNPFNSFWDFGNYILTIIFNLKNNTKLNDSLCCAKSFYKSDLNQKYIKSNSFDIDVELTGLLLKKSQKYKIRLLNYKRRAIKDGKKLRFSDSWKILKRIIRS